MDGAPVVLFEIQPALNRPVRFKGTEYVRIGSYKKKLHDHPEKERELWKVFERAPFETGVAKENASSDDVLALLDYPNYFTLMKQPLPDNRAAILERLAADKIISPSTAGGYHVTNVGAILFARNLSDFDRLARKALRVIIYKGANRVETIKEQKGGKGYAIGFEGAIAYINDQLPQNEQIGQALGAKSACTPRSQSGSWSPMRLFTKTSASPARGRWSRFSRTGWRSPTPGFRLLTHFGLLMNRHALVMRPWPH